MTIDVEASLILGHLVAALTLTKEALFRLERVARDMEGLRATLVEQLVEEVRDV